MTRIVLLDPSAPDRLDRMRAYLPEGWQLQAATSRAPHHQIEALQGISYAITGDMPVTAAMMAQPGLRGVHKWGVGFDNIDLEAARRHGVRVLRTAGSNAVTVAETTLGLILAVTRNIGPGQAGILRGDWLKGELAASSITLSGRCIGIVGFGAIGQALARLLQGFGCEILYSKRNPLTAGQDRALGVCHAPLDDLLARADVVTLNCELNDSTRGLIDARRLVLMRPGAVLVNAARGGVMVEADLAAAIRSGHLGGAAIDVFAVEPITADSPLLGLPRVVLTPHIAAISADSYAPTVTRMMTNLLALHEGRPVREGDALV